MQSSHSNFQEKKHNMLKKNNFLKKKKSTFSSKSSTKKHLLKYHEKKSTKVHRNLSLNMYFILLFLKLFFKRITPLLFSGSTKSLKSGQLAFCELLSEENSQGTIERQEDTRTPDTGANQYQPRLTTQTKGYSENKIAHTSVLGLIQDNKSRKTLGGKLVETRTASLVNELLSHPCAPATKLSNSDSCAGARFGHQKTKSANHVLHDDSQLEFGARRCSAWSGELKRRNNTNPQNFYERSYW